MRSLTLTFAVLFIHVQYCTVIHGLSTPTATSPATRTTLHTQQRPIQRVAIIGSGIAGLSLAHALENSPDLRGDGAPIQVTVYDARPSPNYEAGAGVQLNGGMSVLRKINPTLQRAVADAAMPLEQISSRTKPWFGSKPFDTLLTLPIAESIRSVGGRVQDELIIDGEVMAHTIMRGALQEALMDTLPKETLARVKFGKSMTAMNGGASDDDNNGITVSFGDGTSEGPFDLVVGCDGVNSAVKEYVETGAINNAHPGKQGRSQTLYSGIRIRYAVQDENTSDEADDDNTKEKGNARLTQYFGNGAYALSGKYGSGKGRPPIKCAFTIYLDDDYIGPFRKRSKKEGTIQEITSTEADENSDWSQDNRKGTGERMLDQVEAFNIPDIEIRPIIENASRFFELGVYLHSPFSWGKGWSKEVAGSSGRYCVTSGDAAHAMPPFLGQGSNQAIQDSYCLAKKLFQYNKHLQSGGVDEKKEDVVVGIAKVLKSYEHIRWGPTTSISAKASVLGYLEAGTGFIAKFRDVFFFTLGSLGVAKRVYLGAAVPNVGDDEPIETDVEVL